MLLFSVPKAKLKKKTLERLDIDIPLEFYLDARNANHGILVQILAVSYVQLPELCVKLLSAAPPMKFVTV
jgi:hypothetical protein